MDDDLPRDDVHHDQYADQCPECGTLVTFSTDRPESGYKEIRWKFMCAKCYTTWTAVFTFNRYEEVEKP